jgi:hypothetical protein
VLTGGRRDVYAFIYNGRFGGGKLDADAGEVTQIPVLREIAKAESGRVGTLSQRPGVFQPNQYLKAVHAKRVWRTYAAWGSLLCGALGLAFTVAIYRC